MPPVLSRLSRSWALVPLALVPLALARACFLAESDTFWQIRVGLDILRSGHIPATDTYSWTAYGRPWQPNSWLFDVIVAAAYKVGGLGAVALAAAMGVPLIGAVAAMMARRLGARPLPTAVILVVGFAVLTEWLSARPQLADYAAVPALMMLVPPAVQGRWAALAGIAGVQAVWINLHAAAPVGIAVVAATALGTARSVRAIWPVGAAVLGTLVSPFGLAVFLQPRRVQAAASAQVVEWGHIRLDEPLSVVALLLIVAAAVLAGRLRWYAPLAVLTGFAIGGSLMIRLLPIGCVVGLAVLSGAAGRLARVDAYLESRRVLLRVAIAVLVAGELAVYVPRAGAPGRPLFPMRAIAALPPGCRLFNGYDMGGPIVLVRPDVPVSQDSRTDVYGADLIRRQDSVDRGDDGLRALDDLGVTCVLVDPRTPLAAALSTSPAWRETAREARGVLFIRNGTA